MQKRRIYWATILTVLLVVSGIAGDNWFGTNNRVWMKVEAILNAPGFVILHIVGPGHGIRQLVFPFVFSVLFYFAAFWCLLTVCGRLRARRS